MAGRSGQNSSGSREDTMGNGFMMRYGEYGQLRMADGWLLPVRGMKPEDMKDAVIHPVRPDSGRFISSRQIREENWNGRACMAPLKMTGRGKIFV